MALVAHLRNDFGVAARHVHHQLGLHEGTAHRLFDIDMDALRHGQHGDGKVRMVRRGDSYGFNLVSHLVEHLTEVLVTLGVGEHAHDLLGMRRTHVHVAKGDDIQAAGLGEITDNLFSAITDADVGDVHLAVGADDLTVTFCIQQS